MRTKILKKKKKTIYSVNKIQHDALCFCYAVEKNVYEDINYVNC